MPATSHAAGRQFEELGAPGVADGAARLRGTGARPGLPAALSLSGLQSSGRGAFAVLVRDAQGRDLAVHLVGAAAWQCAPRDRYIGWGGAQRAAGLHRIGNHSRFLILPWVRVPHLASHLLGGLARRLSADWPAQHGWRLELLETFVEAGRFQGVAYRAANWQPVGLTTGRTRQEKEHRAQAPRKSVWLYPLSQRFRERLGVLGRRGGVS